MLYMVPHLVLYPDQSVVEKLRLVGAVEDRESLYICQHVKDRMFRISRTYESSR